ncbi:cytochrome c [Vitreimonas sp.]|jgi:mono/diheme cytochrome c family protein|uniref:c-type cytochrome n=1 Tax=Vitreimonas sp. TaxID=3069702 RepID=UPI002EDA2CAD
MKNFGFVILTLALAGCSTGLAQGQNAAADAPSIEAGRHLAEINCATCHAIGAEGESRHPMAPPFRTLSRDYPVTALEEAFAEGILVGHPDMPEFRLAPAQIDDLLSYIESVQERRGG